MSPEQELVLCCARTRVSAEVAGQIKKLASDRLDWASILTLASEHRVLTLLDLNLRRTGATIPQAVTDSLLERSRTNTFLNLQGVAEVHDISALFRSNDIPCA